jgi:hypothetical protein
MRAASNVSALSPLIKSRGSRPGFWQFPKLSPKGFSGFSFFRRPRSPALQLSTRELLCPYRSSQFPLRLGAEPFLPTATKAYIDAALNPVIYVTVRPPVMCIAGDPILATDHCRPSKTASTVFQTSASSIAVFCPLSNRHSAATDRPSALL